MAAEALKTLHTAMLDTREGYEVAEKKAETPALKTLFHQMITMRAKDHEAIHKVLSARGEQPDDSGSFMATVHKTATSLRSAVTGLDRDALSPFIDGEEQIVEKYDAAIDEESSDVSTREMLEEQRAELLAKVGEMKALKSST